MHFGRSASQIHEPLWIYTITNASLSPLVKTLSVDSYDKVGIQENLVIFFKMLDISTTLQSRCIPTDTLYLPFPRIVFVAAKEKCTKLKAILWVESILLQMQYFHISDQEKQKVYEFRKYIWSNGTHAFCVFNDRIRYWSSWRGVVPVFGDIQQSHASCS